MEINLLIACVMIVGCTLCGSAFAAVYQRRKSCCCEILEALRFLKINMVEQLKTVGDALGESEMSLFKSVAQEMTGVCDVADAWQKIRNLETRRGCFADCLTERELRPLDRLFRRIGVSGKEEQELCISGCIAEYELLSEAADKKAERSGKLYASLGSLIGLTLAVLLV